MAATLVFATRGANDYLAVNELRRHGLGPPVLPSINGYFPYDATRARVQGDQCGVELSGKDFAVTHRYAPIRLSATDREFRQRRDVRVEGPLGGASGGIQCKY